MMTSEIPGIRDIKPDKTVAINIISCDNVSGISFGKNTAAGSIDILCRDSFADRFYAVSRFIVSILVIVSRTGNSF
jgi:hypothetical protein